MYVHLSEDIKVVDEVTNTNAVPARLYTHIHTHTQTYRQTYTQTRQTDKTDTHTDRQTDRQSSIRSTSQTDRPAHLPRDSHRVPCHSIVCNVIGLITD